MTIRGLVLDFDGLIIDTERPVYEAWRWVFEQHGCDPMPIDEWATCIGTPDAWDPLDKLAARGVEIDRAVVEARRTIGRAVLDEEGPRPGVVELLVAAREMELPMAIASSSPTDWVVPLLERLELSDWFGFVACFRDGIRGKPHPDLYLEACEAIGVTPSEALAFEDSAHGVAAAKAAGMRCVAVPHALTAGLDFSAADLVVDSLASISLPELVNQWSRPARPEGA